MAEELLSLKWNNHQSHFVDILTFLREQEIFVDATLACGGKLYPAHKFVLSTCSDYFKQMFTKNPSKHPIVFMKDVSCRDLEALLDFMYNGEVNVPQSSLGSLIKTAEGLQIKGLAVPDDPPIPKTLVRDRKDLKAFRDNSYSPPPKRLRSREKSPNSSHISSSASPYSSSATNLPPSSTTRSPHTHHHSSRELATTAAGSLLPTEASVDEDSRTSGHSALSEHSPSLNSKSHIIVNSHLTNDDSAASQSENLNQPSNSEPSPGPSGLHKHGSHSKEEELEIKQEDVVDLGDTEEGDWCGDGDGREGSLDDVGGGEPLSSENATPNFSDVLLPPSDGSLGTGDPAMRNDEEEEEDEDDGGNFCGGNDGGGRAAAAGGGSVAITTNQLLLSDSGTGASASSVTLQRGFDSHHHFHSDDNDQLLDGGGVGTSSSSVRLSTVSSSSPGSSNLGLEVTPSMYRFLLESAAAASSSSGVPATCRSSSLPKFSATSPSSCTSLSITHLPLAFEDSEQRPFPCKFCDARFKKKQHLQNHERIHTGEKYVCILCGQGFSRLHILKHHVSRKHNVLEGSNGGTSSSSVIQHN